MRLLCLVLTTFCANFSLFGGENFIVLDAKSGATLYESGLDLDTRVTPASTFKIALSLIGFELGILENEEIPLWPFVEGYKDDLEQWKKPQTPRTWMKDSCVWYSQLLTPKIGYEHLQAYIREFGYGNANLSGDPGKNNGLTRSWLGSSLKITPREQALFLQKVALRQLPLTAHAMQMTKNILYHETLSSGFELYGKTGLSSKDSSDGTKMHICWFVGWVEKGEQTFTFAYNTLGEALTTREERIARVKELLNKTL